MKRKYSVKRNDGRVEKFFKTLNQALCYLFIDHPEWAHDHLVYEWDEINLRWVQA